MKEIFKDIPGYEYLYQVSTIGRVKSFRGKNEKILKNYKDKRGYSKVVLCDGKSKKLFGVHVLVALTFIPNFLNKPQVSHIDNNPSNNCVSNLRWETQSENILWAFKCNRAHSPKWCAGKYGKNHPRSKPVLQYDKNMNLINEYDGLMDAFRKTGADYRNIYACIIGKTKTCRKFIWKYKN